MASIVDPCNDTGSPSMSRTEDNLSNSEGPLLKRSVGKSNTTDSSENVTCMKSDLPHRSSTFVCHEESLSPCENTKKRYCLWGLTFLLGIVGLCNLLLSITIITVLRVSRGMEAMEIIPEAKLIKFYGQTDLDKVCIYENVCQGYGDEPVELVGDASSVLFTVKNRRLDDARANFRLLQNGTGFSLVESFEVQDSRTGNTFFSTNFPNFGLPSGVRKVAVKLAETHRIVSPVNLSLVFESNRQITIHGAESTTMDGKAIIWMADNNMYIKSNHSIILNGKKGIFFDLMKMPLAPVYEQNEEKKFLQYKLCVCMPQGKLFRVPVQPGSHVKVNCARITTSPEHNPCQ